MAQNLAGLFGSLENIDDGGCPRPFISESLHPYQSGYLAGRNCAENPLSNGVNATRCCIPCPVFEYVYDDNFYPLSRGAGWTHTAGLILCVLLLLSMAILPTKYTRRVYLNVMLLVGVCILSLGFVIPLAAEPNQCYDPITPNDMNSDLACAFGGGMVTFGGLFLVTWILARAFFMHLQICWNFSPGKVSYITTSVVSTVVTIALTAATLAHAGVSYRFGAYCLINVGSIATYWGWILAFAALAFVLQVATFLYCIKVYLAAGRKGRQQLPSTNTSLNSSTIQARVALSRVQAVLALQWRSLTIVMLAIFNFAFVCVVFIILDDQLTVQAFNNTDALIPWIICILSTQDKKQCLQYTGPIILPQKIAVATLFLLGFAGIETFVMLCRGGIFVGWWKVLRGGGILKKRAKTRAPNDNDFFIVNRGQSRQGEANVEKA